MIFVMLSVAKNLQFNRGILHSVAPVQNDMNIQ